CRRDDSRAAPQRRRVLLAAGWFWPVHAQNMRPGPELRGAGDTARHRGRNHVCTCAPINSFDSCLPGGNPRVGERVPRLGDGRWAGYMQAQLETVSGLRRAEAAPRARTLVDVLAE